MAFFVYVLLNPKGETYVGHTDNLPRRLSQHNDPACRLTLHTKRHPGPWKLIHSERFPTRSAAMRRERELKTGKGRDWIRKALFPGC
jgi:putative endonuclease